MIRRLALASTGFARDGFYPEIVKMQAQVSGAMAGAMKGTPMYKSYLAVAPTPGDFPRLLEMGAWMRTPYDWSSEVPKPDDARDARPWGQRHVPAGPRRGVLPAARRRVAQCRLAARAHGDEPLGDPAGPHPLRHLPRARAHSDGDAFLNGEKRSSDWSGEAKP
jgi:hypothetical protein